MNHLMRVCVGQGGYHVWYTEAPTSPVTFADVMTESCPEHGGLPFHNGPDDPYAQEDDE